MSAANRVGVSRDNGISRKEQVILSRMVHSNLNGTLHIMRKRPTGMCAQCQEYETVEHVLISCGKFTQEDKKL